MAWRLVDSGLISPEESSATDEAILVARIKDLVPDTLHIYRRDKPTVSLGYFQKVKSAVDLDFCKSRNIGILRRMSGGSAIYTDEKQLIYAAIVKKDLGSVRETYEKICGAVILGLGLLGIKAKFKPSNDILVGGKKVSGNAQLRRQGTILQHGTILVEDDFETMFKALKVPESKFKTIGLKHPVQKMTSLKLEGYKCGLDELKDALTRGYGDFFGDDVKKAGLTDDEKKRVTKLVKNKYGKKEWNYKF
jgi:lipoate-protein ligase A